MIRVLRPDVTEAPAAALELPIRRALPEQPVIGLIANGKPLAKELLAILAGEIAANLGRRVELAWLEKPSAAYQISAEEADVMAVRAHIIITGLGD
jgi:ethanolamine utilization microcompartment shell protein EutL